MGDPRVAAGPVDVSSVEAVLAGLRAVGGRVTPARRILVEALFAADAHLSAEDLAATVHDRAPDVHLSTIYRNLEELEQMGVVTHAHLGHGPATYQLAPRTHAHLVCSRCGTRVEAPARMFADLRRRARDEFGFTIDPTHFAVVGLCASCSGHDAPGSGLR